MYFKVSKKQGLKWGFEWLSGLYAALQIRELVNSWFRFLMPRTGKNFYEKRNFAQNLFLNESDKWILTCFRPNANYLCEVKQFYHQQTKNNYLRFETKNETRSKKRRKSFIIFQINFDLKSRFRSNCNLQFDEKIRMQK